MKDDVLLLEAPHYSHQGCPNCSATFEFDPRFERWSNEASKNRSYFKFYVTYYKKIPVNCPCCQKTLILDLSLSPFNKIRLINDSEINELYILIAKKKMKLGYPNQKCKIQLINKGNQPCKLSIQDVKRRLSFKNFVG